MSTTSLQPKTTIYRHGQHKIIVRYDPDGPPNQKWQWELTLTRHNTYSGANKSEQTARETAEAALFARAGL